MKPKPLLIGVALSLAALVACAKPHDHGDVGTKGAHGLPGSFAEGVADNDDRQHGSPPFDPGNHDFHGDADTDHKIHSVLSDITAPVPEPQTYVLMLAGLGALGLVVGRRKVIR